MEDTQIMAIKTSVFIKLTVDQNKSYNWTRIPIPCITVQTNWSNITQSINHIVVRIIKTVESIASWPTRSQSFLNTKPPSNNWLAIALTPIKTIKNKQTKQRYYHISRRADSNDVEIPELNQSK